MEILIDVLWIEDNLLALTFKCRAQLGGKKAIETERI